MATVSVTLAAGLLNRLFADTEKQLQVPKDSHTASDLYLTTLQNNMSRKSLV